MKVTRDNHAQFMFKMMPVLTIFYFIQSYFYLKYGPQGLSQEVVIFLGVSLLGVFLYYYLYDRFYQVTFHRAHIEIKLEPLKIQHEFLYREIVNVEIHNDKKSYSNLIIHLRDGEVHKIAHVDNAHAIRKFILERT